MLVDSGRNVAARLLAWYDIHARRLPWRAAPGKTADPYAVWLSEIMLQQTTVAAAAPYFTRFLARWPTVQALAGADETEVMAAWAGLGYYARARNLIACARAVAASGGGFPDDEAGLLALPGIGRYTAAAVAAIGFGRRAVVVDANVERVVARLSALETPLPQARPEIARRTDGITPDLRAGDFAQAMMDLGATVCTTRAPACAICPLADGCVGRSTGAPESYPRKAPKAAKPIRHATFFWVEAEERVLLVQRPPKGLLGGMRALPTGPWADADPGQDGAPIAGDWVHAGAGRHVFTHFALDYRIVSARLPARTDDGEWWPINDLAIAGLPTLFANASTLVRSARAPFREEPATPLLVGITR